MKKSIFNLLMIIFVAGSFLLTSCGDDDGPTTTRVFGTITIENTDIWETWQDSGEVQVTIFPEFSLNPPAGWGEVPDGAFGPGTLGFTTPLGAPYNSQNPVVLTYEAGKTTYDYEIELEPGTYSGLSVGLNHFFVNDPNRQTATLGVHWGNENEVSHGIVIKVDVGGGMIVTPFNYPAPTDIVIEEGQELEINFKADFAFVEQWY